MRSMSKQALEIKERWTLYCQCKRLFHCVLKSMSKAVTPLDALSFGSCHSPDSCEGGLCLSLCRPDLISTATMWKFRLKASWIRSVQSDNSTPNCFPVTFKPFTQIASWVLVRIRTLNLLDFITIPKLYSEC